MSLTPKQEATLSRRRLRKCEKIVRGFERKDRDPPLVTWLLVYMNVDTRKEGEWSIEF